MRESKLLFLCATFYFDRCRYMPFPQIFTLQIHPLYQMKACTFTWHSPCGNIEKPVAEKSPEFMFCFKSSPVTFTDGNAGQNSPLLCFFYSHCNKD